jgi:hypothetical protein
LLKHFIVYPELRMAPGNITIKGGQFFVQESNEGAAPEDSGWM